MNKQTRFLLSVLFLSLVVCGGTFWYFEKPSSLVDVVWWWFVTSSTVGYGDVVPLTIPGRAAGALAIFAGIYGYTYAISLIIQTVKHRVESAERGLEDVKSTGHVLICEYTAYADELIQQNMAEGQFARREIVVLTALVERLPYTVHRFVYGVPISPQALKKANASEAAYIFVFSNERFREPDKKSLHVVSRIMRLNAKAPIFVELNDPDHFMVDALPRPVIAMKTDDLLHAALKHRYINVNRYLDQVEPSGRA